MLPSEAIDEVVRLKGLFPGTTREQEDFWFTQFQRFPLTVVHWAVDELALSHGDFVDRPGLLALIGSRMQTAEARATAARRQVEERAAALQREEVKTAANWSEVDRFIAGLNEVELAEAKARVLSGNPHLAELLTGKDPRKSSTLKALIYGELRRAVPA